MSTEGIKVINDDDVERKELHCRIQRLAEEALESGWWSKKIADKVVDYLFNDFVLIRKTKQDNLQQ